jgi:hypothetical protein
MILYEQAEEISDEEKTKCIAFASSGDASYLLDSTAAVAYIVPSCSDVLVFGYHFGASFTPHSHLQLTS